jgi:hypothetical protein
MLRALITTNHHAMNAMIRRFCNLPAIVSLAVAIACTLVSPSAPAQQRIDEPATCKAEDAATASAERASFEKYLLAEREATERMLDALLPILESSDEPLAWLWAVTLQSNRMSAAFSEKENQGPLAAAQQNAGRAQRSSIQSQDLLLKRALDAAPRNPAVLISLVQTCKFQRSAFCEAHPDLLDRWQAVDPDNGLLLHEKAVRQPVAVQIDLLGKMLAAPKFVSHPEEGFRVVKKLEAAMPEKQRDELLRGLWSMVAVSPIALVSGPEVCKMAQRHASGMVMPGDVNPADAVRQQCVDLMRRIANEAHDPLWEQYASMQLRMMLPEGPERAKFQKRFEQVIVEVMPVTQIEMAVFEGRLPRAEANKLLRQYMEDVVSIGQVAARKRHIESSKALLATLEAAASK